ncbi:uncharacterized protein (TIGR02118 family) [Herbihabitans rhizosphaerae]|uniref:Uncharacterized protein (TIGR02118 family) n=1 Tax=Herbihabitans rhizosphaerae TaxID=1872711 RepID=A0A4V2ERK7_9PSEU|nr:EthD family reductase [Herbihabitans rhizosphaerae]RZS32289.1 uncharacterized protein (TIGR02118 family) [Herbihabitans rhizosphaerae]
MHKLVVLYPPPADPAHFRRYYETEHLPLVREMPNLLSYRYSFDIGAAQGESPYFAIFEADFEDADAMDHALTSPQGQAALADVPNYASGGSVAIDYPVASTVDGPQRGT